MQYVSHRCRTVAVNRKMSSDALRRIHWRTRVPALVIKLHHVQFQSASLQDLRPIPPFATTRLPMRGRRVKFVPMKSPRIAR